MDGNPKQMIVERIKGATNLLVTVSRNPSVDALAAALALTLMINKMDKHATAVFSGEVPPAISFLEPSKTFESNVNSLRDFIIALDKEKADRLRYKIEDDVVRIYITPYRTTISQDDLQFSQGDFNVDLIVALGVDKREDLDQAISAHGRILHDATVATININTEVSSLGNVDWSDASASSLCEMLMSLSEALQPGVLDQQIASALLTGIVAATDRFSNPHTNPKVMTMAAQLMAAGANQQLIAAQLELGESPARQATTAPVSSVNTTAQADGSMQVQHDTLPEPPQPIATPVTPVPAPEQPKAEPALQQTPEVPSAEQSTTSLISPARVSDWRDTMSHPPLMGAALSATADEAQKDKLREETDDRNRTILSHDTPAESAPLPVTDTTPEPLPTPADVALDYEPSALPTPAVPESHSSSVSAPTSLDSQSAQQPVTPPALTIADLEAEAHNNIPQPETLPAATIDEARAAVDSALHEVSSPFAPPVIEPAAPAVIPPSPQAVPPVAPLPQPTTEITLPPPPPLPDFSSLPPLPPLAPEPTQPTAPVSPLFPDLNPPVAEASSPAAPADPGQFRLPGQ